MLEVIFHHLFLILARRWCPLPRDYDNEGPPLEKLSPKFVRIAFWSVPIGIVVAVSLTYLLYCILYPLQQWNSSRYEPAVYHICNPPYSVLFASMLLGLALSIPATRFIHQLILGDKFALFVRCGNLRDGLNRPRLFNFLFWCFWVLSFIVLASLMNEHVVINRDNVRFISWFGLYDSTRTYTAVVRIRTARAHRHGNGEIIRERWWLVEFDDGSDWNVSSSDTSVKMKEEIAKYISQQSGKPILELPILDL